MAAPHGLDDGSPEVIRVCLIGRFTLSAKGRTIGSWPRPSARRLCQLLLVSPGRHISRDSACEALFPSLPGDAAARSLYKAQSMARLTLGDLGNDAARLLRADSSQIWASPDVALSVDLDTHEEALRAALTAKAGLARDTALVGALATGGTPLEDEPKAEWAARVRERIEYLRQEARLELARDRSRGVGRAHPEEVLEAWQACLETDPTDEEAASALMRIYLAQGRRALAIVVYERCSAALADLGLKPSAACEEVRAGIDSSEAPEQRTSRLAPNGFASRLAPNGFATHRTEERRLVSVVFVELSPSGAGAQADPEDLHEKVGVGLARTISELEDFGGTVVSISGSGLSALFGAPLSHEDDPERALRSAFRVAAVLGRPPAADSQPRPPVGATPVSPDNLTISTRIGIETGPAVVGRLTGSGQSGYGAVGDVVGVAAALQSMARPGTVLVGPVTRAATEGMFEWGPEVALYGEAGARALMGTYLVRPRPRVSAEAGRRRLAADAKLVGRDEELTVLTDAVRKMVSGHGGTVVITGEPGVGKTRLVSECRKYFMGWVGAASGRLPLWLEGRCASYGSSTPFGAYQQLLSRFIGSPLEAGDDVLRPALESAVRAVAGPGSDLVPVLAQMLGMALGPGGEHLAKMSPSELHHAIFSAMRSLLASLVAHGPTVLTLEDLHWSDPTSLRLTAELSTLCSGAPLLVLVTRRPEPDPGGADLEAALEQEPSRPLRRVELAPIEKTYERTLARSLLGGEVSEEILEKVCQGVDGNPLFLEERVASLLDTGALRRHDAGWRLEEGAVAVPQALERLIRSRADRLSPSARTAIVAASVLGQEVEFSTLRAVSELNSGLERAVAELVSAGLLVEIPSQPEPVYHFRHALIRDATYKGLLRSQRRLLHARAAWDLETRYTNRLEEVAAVLGHHFAAAGEQDRAAHYLELAGDRAARVFANEEAIAQYRHALVAIGLQAPLAADPTTLGSSRKITAAVLYEKLTAKLTLVDRFEEARAAAVSGLSIVPSEETLQAARLHYVLGRVELQDDGFPAAEAAFEAAQKLVGPCGLDDDQERVDFWLWLQFDFGYLCKLRRDFERQSSIIANARPLAEARGSRMLAAHFNGFVIAQHLRERRYRVDTQVVEEHRRRAEAAQAAQVDPWEPRNVQTFRYHSLQLLGSVLAWHGDVAEAREALLQALAGAERQGSPNARAVTLTELAIAAWRAGDAEEVRRLVPQALALAAAGVNQSYVMAATAGLETWLAWLDRRGQDVVDLGRQAVGLWGAQEESYPYYRCIPVFPLAGALIDLGQTENAVEAARLLLDPLYALVPDELEATVVAAGEAWDRDKPELAGRLLREAITLARELHYA